jgi:hypothetical protein
MPMEEQYWIRSNGKMVKVEDMNEFHARNALRQLMRDVLQGDVEATYGHIGSEAEFNNQEDVA